MPVSYFINHEKRRIYSRATGTVTYIDLREHMLSEFGKSTAGYAELFECTGAEADMNAGDIRALVKERSQLAKVQEAAPVAIVAPADNFFELFQMFDDLTSDIRPISIFRNFDEAERWLDALPEAPKPQG
jgi:hypothetical protein